MNIYFAGAIAGGRHYLDVYREIAAYLKNAGHRVLTEHVVRPDVLEFESAFTPRQIYTRDIAWLEECDRVVAEVSTPSLGVGYEICRALQLGKPVLCLYNEDVFLTRMLTGNSSPYIRVKPYGKGNGWREILEEFLRDPPTPRFG